MPQPNEVDHLDGTVQGFLFVHRVALGNAGLKFTQRCAIRGSAEAHIDAVVGL
jgi:hypothetical protein